MVEAGLRARLKNRMVTLSVTLNFFQAGLAEFLADSGFDCIVLDGEHGPLPDAEVENVVRASQLGGAATLLRLPVHGPSFERYLDIGVTGLQLPQVDSPSQVSTTLRAVKFPPLGKRGSGTYRAGHYALPPGGWARFTEAANEASVIVIHIESKRGIDALPGLLRMEDLDAVVIGHQDLAMDLGHPGDATHPDVAAAIRHIADLVIASGKALGMAAGTAEDATKAIDLGATYLVTSTVALLRNGAGPLLSALSKSSQPALESGETSSGS